MTPINEKAPYTIGVDIGGTNTALALVDMRGNIIAHDTFATASDGFKTWLETLGTHIEKMLSGMNRADVRGIGIGAPCADTSTGIVSGATNLNWDFPAPLAKEVGALTGLRTVVANDANAAAIGEMSYGAARGMDNFIELTLGTGVGAGVVVDRHLLLGASGYAGEFGHVGFGFGNDRVCSCGRTGCLETVASAKGVITTALQMLDADPGKISMLHDIPRDVLTPKHVTDAAELGDPIAREVYEFTGRCIGEACAAFAAFADPEAIVFFGGVAKAGEWILQPAREAFKKSALHLYADRVRLIPSELPDNDAALLGCAALVAINTL